MSSISSSDISLWVVAYISKLARLPIEEIRTDAELSTFGIDSTGVVGLAIDLGDWVGVSLDPSLIYEYRTIAELSAYVAQCMRGAGEIKSVVSL